ncbi:MAG: M23 family metallopeptidase [Microbacterium sp.]
MTRRALREAARAKAEAAASRANEVEPVASSPVEDASDTTPEVAPVESAPRAEAAEPLTEDEFAAATEAFRVARKAPSASAAGARARIRRERIPSAARVSTHPARARRVMTTAVASLSAMAAAGLLAFGLTTPLGAVATGAGDGTASALSSASTASAGEVTASGEDEEIQAFVAGDDAAAPELDRVDDYSAASFADLAEASGINTAGAFFTNDPTADIQWPFAVGTGMSYGYGMRSGRLHEGIDFTPGSGAPVQSIADGTVRIATESGGAYGVNVYIDHVIDGQTITSHYAHMQYGSLRVTAGQKVEVGDVIGLVGDTGRSFGAHAHFELLSGGSTFDPLPWLEEHAGTHLSSEDEESGDEDVDFASDDAE